MELPAGDLTLLREHEQDLKALGFACSFFGGNSVAIESVPVDLARGSAGNLLQDCLAEVSQTGSAKTFEDRKTAVMARVACHAAIRAGDIVSSSEAEALFADLDSIPYAANCPHGRPVMVRLSEIEVERWFRRH